MATTKIKRIAGLYTSPNDLQDVPEGALTEAKNCSIRRDGILESRYGFNQTTATNSVATSGAYIKTILPFNDVLICVDSAGRLIKYDWSAYDIVANPPAYYALEAKNGFGAIPTYAYTFTAKPTYGGAAATYTGVTYATSPTSSQFRMGDQAWTDDKERAFAAYSIADMLNQAAGDSSNAIYQKLYALKPYVESLSDDEYKYCHIVTQEDAGSVVLTDTSTPGGLFYSSPIVLAGTAVSGNTRLRGATFGKSLYFETTSGIRVMESTSSVGTKSVGIRQPAAPHTPAVPSGCDITNSTGALEASAGVVTGASIVGYRTVFYRFDTHGRKIVSPPSPTLYVNGSTATGGLQLASNHHASAVTLIVPIPEEITNGTYYCELYRTKNSASATDLPTSTFYKVAEKKLTPTGMATAKTAHNGAGASAQDSHIRATFTSDVDGSGTGRASHPLVAALAVGDLVEVSFPKLPGAAAENKNEHYYYVDGGMISGGAVVGGFRSGVFAVTDIDANDTYFDFKGTSTIPKVDALTGHAQVRIVGFQMRDEMPDSGLNDGLGLYTNELNEGDANANFRPPVSKCLASWQDRMWYGGVKTRASIDFEITGIKYKPRLGGRDQVQDSGMLGGFGLYEGMSWPDYLGNPVRSETGGLNQHFFMLGPNSDSVPFITWTDSELEDEWDWAPTAGSRADFRPYGVMGMVEMYDTGTPTVNIRETAIRFVRAINEHNQLAAVKNWSDWRNYPSSGLTQREAYDISARHLSDPSSDKQGKIRIFVEQPNASITAYDGSITVDSAPNRSGASTSALTGVAPSPFLSTYSDTEEYNRLYYSKPNQPEAVPLLNYLTVGNATKRILNIVPLRDRLIVFKEDGVWQVSGEYPFRVDLVDPEVVLLGEDTPKTLGGSVMALSNKGVVSVTETGVGIISKGINQELFDDINTGWASGDTTAFWSVTNERENQYLLWVSTSKAYVYHASERAWTTWEHEGITHGACLNLTNLSKSRMMLSTNSTTDTRLLQEGIKLGANTDYLYYDEARDNGAVTIASFSASAGTLTFSGAYSGLTTGDVIIANIGGGVYKSFLVTGGTTTVPTVETDYAGSTFTSNATSYTVQKGIPVSVYFCGDDGGEPELQKHFNYVTFLFDRQNTFYEASANFATDVSLTPESQDIAPNDRDTELAFTTPSAGVSYRTTYSASFLKRVIVPQDKQRAQDLEVGFSMTEGTGYFRLKGITIGYELAGGGTSK